AHRQKTEKPNQMPPHTAKTSSTVSPPPSTKLQTRAHAPYRPMKTVWPIEIRRRPSVRGMCSGALQVCARLEDLRDLVDGEADLVVGREVVRPEAKAGVGPVVADDLARGKLRVHGLEVRHA